MRGIFSMIAALAIVLFSFSTFGQAQTGDLYSVVLKKDANVEQFKGDLELTGAEIVYAVPEIGYYQVEATTEQFGDLKKFSTVQAANSSLSWKLDEMERIEMTEEQMAAFETDTKDIRNGKNKGKKQSGDLSGDLSSAANPAAAKYWSIQWDMQRITQDGSSYDVHTGSHDTVVAVIDTGINPDHVDLAPNLLPGSKSFVPAGGFRGTEPNETGDPNDFVDRHGHGSHVSGSIAGAGYGIAGVAPDLGLRAYRVFGTSSAESAWIYKAMVAAANDGSDVLSMSLGGWDIMGQTFVKDADTGKWINAGHDVADFVAYKRAVQYVESKGAIIVAAAGNDGLDLNDNNQVMDYLNNEYGSENVEFRGTAKTVPAELANVIGVSATGPNDVLAVYSNYGESAVDIAAPGGDLALLYEYINAGKEDEYYNNLLYYNEFTLSASNTSGYYFSVGTSMATPKVSAVAGLIIDQHNGELTPSQVKSILLNEGVDAVSGEEAEYFGHGHLNAYKAVN